jgi:hypothetical protein
MAQYRADVWMGSASGRQEVTVSSNTGYGAKEQIMNIYGVRENDIVNLRQVSGGGSGGGGSSIEGGGWLIGLFGILGLWYFLTPWVAMLAGGAVATWVAEKLCGTSLEGACDNDNDKAVAIILASALIVGGVGFVQGNKWNKEIHSDSGAKVQEVKKVQQ